MKRGLDMDKIAKALGAHQRGKVSVSGGYFGAMQLLADIEARFRVPAGGGRATDPNWTERRLVPLAPRTLRRLEELAAKIREQSRVAIEPMQLAAKIGEQSRVSIEPMQLAALLLENTTETLGDEEPEQLLRSKANQL